MVGLMKRAGRSGRSRGARIPMTEAANTPAMIQARGARIAPRSTGTLARGAAIIAKETVPIIGRPSLPLLRDTFREEQSRYHAPSVQKAPSARQAASRPGVRCQAGRI